MELLLGGLFFFFGPLVSLLNRQAFSQGSGPRGLHIHTEPAPAGSFSDIAVLWYLSFLFTDTQHISQKLATVIYSIPSVDGLPEIPPAISTHPPRLFGRYQKAGYANQWWSMHAVCPAHKGTLEKHLAVLRILHVNQDADSGFGSTATAGSAAAGSGFAAAGPASPVTTDSPLIPSTTRNPDASTVISSSLRSCSRRL